MYHGKVAICGENDATETNFHQFPAVTKLAIFSDSFSIFWNILDRYLYLLDLVTLFFHAESSRIVPVVQLGVEQRSDPHRDFNARATFSTNAFTPEVK